jgi:sugar lactone lactonase YvrE
MVPKQEGGSGGGWRWLKRILMLLIALVIVLLAVVRVRYGGGSAYPDVSTPPLIGESAMEKLVTLNYPPGNVAMAADSRIFFNYHPFAQAHRFGQPTVFELVDGKPQPYPNADFQAKYQGVFGMTVDRQQRLWFIEPAGLDHARTRLLAFDLKTNQQVFEHWFVKGELPFAQDLRVTADGNTVVLADTGLFKFTDPALIVFDVASKTHRKLLSQHASLRPQDWVIRTPYGPHKLGYGLVTFAVGVDGIEFSSDGQWLYYATMTHDRVFRLPMTALMDAKLDDAALASRIEEVGSKPLSDGITFDARGRLLVTDIENGGIVRIDPQAAAPRKPQTLVKSAQVIWADGVVVAPDGSVIFTDSAIPAYIDQLAAPPSAERLQSARPYHLWRFKAPAE